MAIRLPIPAFGLSWLPLTDTDVMLIPGGGGSARSGVNNQILLLELQSKAFLPSIETNSDGVSTLYSGISVGWIDETIAICAIVSNSCILYTLKSKDPPIFTKKSIFQVEFEKEKEVNCCSFAESGHIVTGGDDNVCRLWDIDTSDEDNFKVTLLREFKGHTQPIKAISFHPIYNWVATASNDGTCKFWDLENEDVSKGATVPLATLSIGDPSIIPSTALTANPKIQCRGCCFSLDGDLFYTIRSGARGATHLIQWKVEKNSKVLEETKVSTSLSFTPLKVILVSSVPCTCMQLHWGGEYLAIGASDGSVSVFTAGQHLKKVFSAANHDFPVTGLSFAPRQTCDRSGSPHLLSSCSADNKLFIMNLNLNKGSGGILWVFQVIVSLLLLLAVLFFIYSTGSLYLQAP